MTPGQGQRHTQGLSWLSWAGHQPSSALLQRPSQRPQLDRGLMRGVIAVLLPLLLILAPGPLMASVIATNPVSANTAAASDEQPVVEQLRLQVPAEQRELWLAAERSTWEPWLARQDGFLGRELLWDPRHGEATLLIRWASRRQWKAIEQAEIDTVQANFEEQVRRRLGSTAPNPFPLLYEGELISP